jgi:hypothetical protein
MVDWAEWSREAVRLMQARNAEWQKRFDLAGARYAWDLATATMTYAREHDVVLASITLVGTTSAAEGTFLWAWANETIPPVAREGLERVRAFGKEHDLPLLTDAETPGGRAEGLELVALAGRITDAEGTFVDSSGDITCFFLLRDFRVSAKP